MSRTILIVDDDRELCGRSGLLRGKGSTSMPTIRAPRCDSRRVAATTSSFST